MIPQLLPFALSMSKGERRRQEKDVKRILTDDLFFGKRGKQHAS
jgi:hypothetical protein